MYLDKQTTNKTKYMEAYIGISSFCPQYREYIYHALGLSTKQSRE